jgi:hypothetical protein
MRRNLCVTLLVLLAATATAQTNLPPSSATAPPAKEDKPLVLVGCVVSDTTSTDHFTLSDPKAGVSYRLRGMNVSTYFGRRVRIIGGLFPSANVAAQAGAIDSASTAMAILDANRNMTGQFEPLEFRITRVMPLTGTCPPPAPHIVQ